MAPSKALFFYAISLFVSILLMQGVASCQVFDAYDVAPAAQTLFRYKAVLSDGSIVVSVPREFGADTARWIAYDRNGSVINSVGHTTSTGTSQTSSGDGDFFSTFNISPLLSNDNSIDPDTCTTRFSITKFGSDLSPTWTRSLNFTFVEDLISEPPYGSESRVYMTPSSSNYFIAATYENNGVSYPLHLIKVDSNHTIVWARQIGFEQPLSIPAFDELLYLSSEPKNVHIFPDSNDNVYGLVFVDEELSVFCVNNDGSLRFSKRYGILPGGPFTEEWGFMHPSSTGVALAAFKHVQGIGNFCYVLECDTAGAPTSSFRLDLGNQASEVYSFDISSNGDYVLSVLEAVIQTPPAGNIATSHKTRRFNDGTTRRFQFINDGALQNDTMVIVGTFYEQDLFLGTASRSTLISRTPLSSFDQCVWQDSIITRSDVPLSVVTMTDLTPDFIIQDVTQEWSYVNDTLPVPFFPIPAQTPIDRCSIFTGTDEQTEELEALSLFPSPVAGNGTLHVEATTGTLFRILDLTGRSVLAGRPVRSSDPWSIPLPGLKPGLYLLELMDATGSRTGTGRFLVE
ncbi:MAG: T9SS type A sorting domain-containing protein [Flavobacteriales bacterium]|nr:T9SS type A sorting domain-containing protein [Flavobacteriales bacterium]MCB1218949.1 T9SS type A sorting domain-containing protein [bacterium]